MRIIFHSNSPFNQTGYGKQAALIVPRIDAMEEHEIAAFAAPYSFGAAALNYDGIPLFGCARDSAGNDIITQNHEFFDADLTITLADPFGLLKAATAGVLRQLNLAMLFPVDCSPLGEQDVTVLRESGAIPIAISRFGERMLRDEGADPLFIPHGVDTQLYCPGDPVPFRDTVPGIGPDTFVVGLLAMNRDVHRKGISEQMQAFANFHRRHPDTFLSLHTTPLGGINIRALAARLGIGKAVEFPDSYYYDMGLITEENMVTWYNGLDVLSLCSFAEGFGLPLIEAQACGIPVITTDASATAELCGAGWLVSGTDFWANGHNAWWKRPDVSDIEDAYETAWEAWQDGTLPKKDARDFALNYDIDRVFELCWKPALAEIEKRINHPGRIFPAINDGYLDRASRWSDIQEYLPFLRETAESYPKVRVLELGSRLGYSTLAFLAAADDVDGHVWSADIDPVADNPRGMGQWKDHPRWTFIQGDDMDPDVQEKLPDEVDVFFLDTSHEYEHTLAELRTYMPRVVKGGIALFHDTRLVEWEGHERSDFPPVTQALDEFCEETGTEWEELPGAYGLGVIRV